MVEVMESWFLADVDALESYYGRDFRRQDLPPTTDVEGIPKNDVLNRLSQATRNTGKGSYSKGKHAFEILEKLDPAKVRGASPHAECLIQALA